MLVFNYFFIDFSNAWKLKFYSKNLDNIFFFIKHELRQNMNISVFVLVPKHNVNTRRQPRHIRLYLLFRNRIFLRKKNQMREDS